MWKLVYYELRKHYFNGLMVVVLSVFVIVNFVKIDSVYENNSFFSEKAQLGFWDAYQTLYEEYKGIITEEKIKKLMEIYNPIKAAASNHTVSTEYDPTSYTYNKYSDEIFLRWCFIDEMEYDYMYKAYANSIVVNAVDNMFFFQSIGNQYEYKKNYRIARLFYQREVPSFYNTESYQYYFYYDFSSLLILMLVVFGMSIVFAEDRETEMYYILSTTKYGKKYTVAAKIISSGIFIVVISSLFLIEDFGVFMKLFHGKEAGDGMLFSLEGFRNTPLNLTMNQYAVLGGTLKILGALEIGAFVLFLSKIFQKTINVMVAGFASVAGLIYMESAVYGLAKTVNPILLFSSRKLFFDTVFRNIMGYPIADYIICIGVNMLILVLFVFLILFDRKLVVGKRRWMH